MNPSILKKPMSAKTAKRFERAILMLCALSLFSIFQPFTQVLFSAGAGLIVLAGLLFNLVPLCQPGRSLGSLGKGALIVFAIFAVVALVAIGFAEFYGFYLKNQ